MKIKYFLLSVVVCLLLGACSTTKIKISGTSGTEIYTPKMEQIGVIRDEGNVTVKVSDNNYYPYLLSKAPQSDIVVPFALDYKKNRHVLDKIGASILLVVPPGLGTLSFIFIIYEDDVYYNYSYLQQITNSDIEFTRPIFTEPIKDRSQLQPKQDVTTQLETSTKRLSQKSTKTFNDYAKSLEGRYVGAGLLTQGADVIESYTDIAVIINRVERNVVEVNVVESNGSEFFASASRYNVEKKSDGSLLLKHSQISDANITIDKDKKLLYLHPKVDIENGIYTLKITVE